MYAGYSKVVPFNELPDPADTWRLVEKIGEGTYGEVHLAARVTEGNDECQHVAIKVMECIGEVVEEIEEEYSVLRDHGQHPNLPHFYGMYLKQDPQEEDQLWIAMELCSGGSVTDLVKAQLEEDKRLSEKLIAFILKETLKALHYLHQNHIIHRDVKGHNILLTANADVKLVDFGVSGHLKNTLARRRTSVGTPFWMAPEVIACEQQLEYDYDIRCDVWSLGVTAIELADGVPPMADLHPMRALFQIPRSPPPALREPHQWSEGFQDFIQKCVIKDFEVRPFVYELLRHPFIQEVPKDVTQLRSELLQLIAATGKTLHQPYVTMKHGKLRSKRKQNQNPISPVDDLATLENLDEEVLVEQLSDRYQRDVIYTFIGDILLAVNPLKPMSIYDEQHSKLYVNVSKVDNTPHIFAIADQAYQAMMHHRHNQCIVISGESGSGKTESANFLIQQLTLLGRAPNRTLENRILQINPLVEAFGNAKTVINDNSSRFGKFLEMAFTSNGKVTGAYLSEYLLEKSRVVHQASGESNFHVFNYILDGLVIEDKLGKYHLDNQDDYRYLSDTKSEKKSMANYNKFKGLQKCFETIGFKAQEVGSVYCILAAILHLGNVDFSESESQFNTVSSVKNKHHIDIVADLLGIDGEELHEALTSSGMVARGETIIRHYTTQEAVNVRDATAKALYGRLFGWIGNKINMLLRPRTTKDTDEDCFMIGILDIFGFENFDVNSFEQLCINIANEQIQYYFNQHIFAWEQQEYKNEGIEGDSIEFIDNRPVLDLFLAKPMGLLALLDEESNFPQATDLTLAEKFGQNIRTENFSRPRSQGLLFTIDHYAGKVEYDATFFLEKNRDRLALEVINVLRVSQVALLRALFNSTITKTGNLAYNSLGSKSLQRASPAGSVTSTLSIRSSANTGTSQARNQQTVATYFRYSLTDLLSKMVTGTPHFVRCLRPNADSVAGFFNHDKVLNQLRCTGVLGTTRIRRNGYSHRIPFSEFLKRYYILGYNFNEKVRVNRESCETLLGRIGLVNWALGKTKVFLKYYHIEQLQHRFEEQQRHIVVAQAVIRMWITRHKFRKQRVVMMESALRIQKVVRGWLVRKKYRLNDRIPATLVIQKMVRSFLVRRRYTPVLRRRHSAVVVLQTATRAFLQRRRYLVMRNELTRSVVKIQSVFRGYVAREKTRHMRMASETKYGDAAVTLQKFFRMWKAQAQFVNLQLGMVNSDSEAIQVAGQVEQSSETISDWLEGTHDSVTSDPRTQPPNVSEERKQKMERAFEVKEAMPKTDSSYYDQMNEANRIQSGLWAAKRGALKKLTSSEGSDYYDSITEDSGKKRTDGLSALTKHLLSSDQATTDNSQGSLPKLRDRVGRQMTKIQASRALSRESSVTSIIPGNENITKQRGGATRGAAPEVTSATTGVLHKSESQRSLAWDDVLEQARRAALAPDAIAGMSVEMASDAGTGTPSILCSEDEDDILVAFEESEFYDGDSGDHTTASSYLHHSSLSSSTAALSLPFASLTSSRESSSLTSASPTSSQETLSHASTSQTSSQESLSLSSASQTSSQESSSFASASLQSSSLASASQSPSRTSSSFTSASSSLASASQSPPRTSSSFTSASQASSSLVYFEYDTDTDSTAYEVPGSWSYEGFGDPPKPKFNPNYTQLPWGSLPNWDTIGEEVFPAHGGGQLDLPFPAHSCTCTACRYSSWLQAIASQQQAPQHRTQLKSPSQQQAPQHHTQLKSPTQSSSEIIPKVFRYINSFKSQAKPDAQFINLLTAEQEKIPKQYPELSKYFNIPKPVPPWKHLYPPTPPIPKDSSDYQTIPAPPRGPPPCPPVWLPHQHFLSPSDLRGCGKRVRFSGQDDIFIRTPSLDSSSTPCDDENENTQSIQIMNHIEDDELVYREELIEEGEAMRDELVRSLEHQQMTSLSSRFLVHQQAEVDEKQSESRWKKVQADTVKEESVYHKILSRSGSKNEVAKGATQTTSPGPMLATSAGNRSDPPVGLPTPKQPPAGDQGEMNYCAKQPPAGHQGEINYRTEQPPAGHQGEMNYRAVLRRTGHNPEAKPATDPEERPLVDYRAVLKRKSTSPSLKKHTILAT